MDPEDGLSPEERMTLDAYNASAERWALRHDTKGFWRVELDRFFRLLPRGNKVLEVGAGGGRDAEELIAFGYDYVGTDISPELIGVARKKNPSGTFIVQSLYDLDFPADVRFDGWWCSAVLLHVPKSKIDRALRRIGMFIKPGGIGFVSIKDGEGEGLEKDGNGGQRFFAYYREAEFRGVLERNGYVVLETNIHPVGPKTNWLGYYVKKL